MPIMSAWLAMTMEHSALMVAAATRGGAIDREEKRQSWRTYAAALLAGEDVDLLAVSKAADWMVKEERKRFDPPDHSGDADKMVEPPEPRPWVGLTDAERSLIWDGYCSGSCTVMGAIERVEDLLRTRNGGRDE